MKCQKIIFKGSSVMEKSGESASFAYSFLKIDFLKVVERLTCEKLARQRLQSISSCDRSYYFLDGGSGRSSVWDVGVEIFKGKVNKTYRQLLECVFFADS